MLEIIITILISVAMFLLGALLSGYYSERQYASKLTAIQQRLDDSPFFKSESQQLFIQANQKVCDLNDQLTRMEQGTRERLDALSEDVRYRLTVLSERIARLEDKMNAR